MKKKIIISIVFLLALTFFVWEGRSVLFSRTVQIATVSTSKNALPEKISYKGVDGKDALWVLSNKENASVLKDKSGLVVSINGREASNAKHEYWAFYVNGKMASVGPAEFITKNSDLIEWKIEKY